MVLRKIMVIIFSAVVLCTSLVATTSAKTMYPPIDDGIAPAYAIAGDPISKLSISGKTAYCTSETRGTGAVSITVEQTLEKYSGWFRIGTMSKTQAGQKQQTEI